MPGLWLTVFCNPQHIFPRFEQSQKSKLMTQGHIQSDPNGSGFKALKHYSIPISSVALKLVQVDKMCFIFRRDTKLFTSTDSNLLLWCH